MKFLFASPHALFDSSSGAAISMYNMLRELCKQGHQVATIQASIYDSKASYEARPLPDKLPLRPFSYQEHGINHTIIPSRHWYRPNMTAIEESCFEDIYNKFLHQAKPDVLITYGGMLLERTMLRNAREQGIKTVFFLVNASYQNMLSFKDVELIITDSQSTSDYYKNKHRLDVKVVGKILDKDHYLATNRSPQYITFINPTPEKGARLVFELARKIQARDNTIKFMIVESRGTVMDTLKILKDSHPLPSNITVMPTQHHMRDIYKLTKLLLLPSFVQESGSPRVALEAMINDIPIIACNHGGTHEMVGDAGTYLNIPESLRKNPSLEIPEETINDWVTSVMELCNNPSTYMNKIAACQRQSQLIDNQRTIDNLINFIKS